MRDTVKINRMKLIGCDYIDNKHIDVYKYGRKFYVRLEGHITERGLNSEEIVCYLMNMAGEKIND